MIKTIVALLTIIGVAACSTNAPVPQKTASTGVSTHEEIDIEMVKTKLGLNRPATDLGLREARFDPCDYGRRGDVQCGPRFLTTVHFQLLCRMSEGTVDTVDGTELHPVRSNAVTFKLGNTMGHTHTDADGFGKVEVVRNSSGRPERLRLTIEDRFVASPASEIKQIVVPENWCRL